MRSQFLSYAHPLDLRQFLHDHVWRFAAYQGVNQRGLTTRLLQLGACALYAHVYWFHVRKLSRWQD